MTREIERVANIPVVQIATIVPIMLTVGSNRIVPGVAIPHPTGRPQLGPEGDLASRKRQMMQALNAMCISIDDQTVFAE